MGIRGLLGMASECPPGSSGDGARKLEAGMHASRPSACDGPAAGSIRRQVSDSSGPPRRLGGRLVNAACGLRVASQGWRRRRSEILSAQEMRSVAWPRTRRLISWSPRAPRRRIRRRATGAIATVIAVPTTAKRSIDQGNPRRNADAVAASGEKNRPGWNRSSQPSPSGGNWIGCWFSRGNYSPASAPCPASREEFQFFFAALAADGARDRRADRG